MGKGLYSQKSINKDNVLIERLLVTFAKISSNFIDQLQARSFVGSIFKLDNLVRGDKDNLSRQPQFEE